jgi:hypothetical protein
MSDQTPLSDKTLLDLYNGKDDLSILTKSERDRLLELTKPQPSIKDKVADALPDVMGAAGGLAARLNPVMRATGPMGSATVSGALGAAGEGYRQLLKHSGELVPAFQDVKRNLLNPETRGATMQGFREGAIAGKNNAVKTAGTQAAYDVGGRAIGGGMGVGGRILASPTGRRVVSNFIAPGVGLVKGGPMGALLGKLLTNDFTMGAARRAAEIGSRGEQAYAQLLRALDPAGMRKNEDEQ